MAMSHLLISLVSSLNSSGRAALIFILLSSLLVRGSMWMEKWGEPGEKESGELGGDGAAGGASESKYCI